jgi:ferritin
MEEFMLAKKILDSLNEQITMEEFSSNLYLAMGSWCSLNGFEGTAKFLISHAEEERLHMKKIFNYILEKGELAVIGEIQKPSFENTSILKLFEDILHHEGEVTRSINEIVDASMAAKDFTTFNFLQWYISEQHEEELLIRTMVDKIKLIGLEGQGKFLIDQEIGRLGQAAASAKIVPDPAA